MHSLQHALDREQRVSGRLDVGGMWVVYMQVWKMSNSAWNSELQQEGIEHQLPNDYLVSLSPWVFNYGAELELPRVCLLLYSTITVVICRRNLYAARFQN